MRVDFDLNGAEGSQQSKAEDGSPTGKQAKGAAGILKKKGSKQGKSGDTNPQKARPPPQKRPEEPKCYNYLPDNANLERLAPTDAEDQRHCKLNSFGRIFDYFFYYRAIQNFRNGFVYFGIESQEIYN